MMYAVIFQYFHDIAVVIVKYTSHFSIRNSAINTKVL